MWSTEHGHGKCIRHNGMFIWNFVLDKLAEANSIALILAPCRDEKLSFFDCIGPLCLTSIEEQEA